MNLAEIAQLQRMAEEDLRRKGPIADWAQEDADPNEVEHDLVDDPEVILRLEGEQEMARERASRMKERRQDAKRKRESEEANQVKAIKGNPHTRRTRIWSRYARIAKAEGKSPELIRALGATKVADSIVPGAPGGGGNQNQVARYKSIIEEEERRIRDAELPESPFAAEARRNYPKYLSRAMKNALRRWKLPSVGHHRVYEGAYIPQSVAHYAKVAAKLAVRKAREAHQRSLAPLMASKAIPEDSLRNLVQDTKTGTRLHDPEAVMKLREAGERMLRRAKAEAEKGVAGCDRLRHLVGSDYDSRPCRKNAFGAWASALFDRPGSFSRSVRRLCGQEWNHLACLLVSEQLQDWLLFTRGISTHQRLTHRDLLLAAQVAKELGPLMGDRFEFFVDDLQEN